MEGISRTLVQEKAVLVARQGDPKSPAAGTLLARQRILHAELEAATARQEAASRPLPAEGAPFRHPDLIRRDIRRIENELRKVQDRLREIDVQISSGASKAAT
jgi:hypothetical protein